MAFDSGAACTGARRGRWRGATWGRTLPSLDGPRRRKTQRRASFTEEPPPIGGHASREVRGSSSTAQLVTCLFGLGSGSVWAREGLSYRGSLFPCAHASQGMDAHRPVCGPHLVGAQHYSHPGGTSGSVAAGDCQLGRQPQARQRTICGWREEVVARTRHSDLGLVENSAEPGGLLAV
jgi:hypothetical protein